MLLVLIFGSSLLDWRKHDTPSKGNEISNDLREGNIACHKSEKGYKAIAKNVKSLTREMAGLFKAILKKISKKPTVTSHPL